eukprot:m.4704 g.4704  ORF g.4704 m.4704 type:complete len:243 (+) comp3070_c0_seq1:279-1007(+)
MVPVTKDNEMGEADKVNDAETMEEGVTEYCPLPAERITPTLKELLDAARSPDDIASTIKAINQVLPRIRVSDLALGTLPSKEEVSQWTTPVKYHGIIETSKVSIGIFMMKPKAHIPLHNHPGMTVMTKCLFGKMRVSSYDWVPGSPDMAELVDRATISAQSRSAETLTPDLCNLHEIDALDFCGFMDIFLPPYSESNDCDYFHIIDKPVNGKRKTIPVGTQIKLEKFHPDFATGNFIPVYAQ